MSDRSISGSLFETSSCLEPSSSIARKSVEKCRSARPRQARRPRTPSEKREAGNIESWSHITLAPPAARNRHKMPDTETGIIEPFPNNVGQGTSSIALTHVEENVTETTPALSLTRKISQFQEETSSPIPGRRKNPALRAAAWLNERYPRTARGFTRILYYIRGPRPMVATPAPIGLVDRTWKVRGRECDVFWEKYVLHFTHFFRKPWIFWPIAVAYIIGLAFFARAQYFFTPSSAFIDCTSAYWKRLDGCGLDGAGCQPFIDAGFEFRCPAGCMATTLQNIRTVGDIELEYVPLVIGGGDNNQTYRGDSFLCAAAIHAGLISDSRGGCATVSLVGTFTNFLSSSVHGITTTPFPSVFPQSYRLSTPKTLTSCEDRRNEALATDIVVTTVLFLVLRPKPTILFWSLVCIGFWHIIFFSDPVVPISLSVAFGTFLPALFICYAFWRVAFRHVMPSFTEIPIERFVWYLPAFWAGVLFNIVVAGIPIDRLYGADISNRPGALVALIIISLIVLALTINQLRVIRKSGWLPHYLKWYTLGALTIVVLACLPTMQFRLHHYFAAILIIPLTAFPTRLSAIYQAFCLGMFLNGAAAYGFDSIFQTVEELRRDAPLGSDLPTFLTNSTTWNASIPLASQVLRWQTPPTGESWDGFALLVDDVERYAGNLTSFALKGLDASIPHFFRIAFQSAGTSGDFTKAAVWYPNGTWIDPGSGAS